LFTDIVGSTEIAAELGDDGWRALLTAHHASVRRLLREHRGTLHDTAGDGIFATFDAPADALTYAVRATEAVRALGVEIRVGIHFGETQEIEHKLGGIAVHTAARVMGQAGPGEIVTSSTVPELVAGAGFTFEQLGARQLKGLVGTTRLVRLDSTQRGPLPHPLGERELRDRRAESAARRAAGAVGDQARRRGMLVGGVAVAVAIVAALVAFPLLRDERPDPAVATLGASGGSGQESAPALAAIDPDTGEMIRRFEQAPPDLQCGTYDHDLAVGAGALWQIERAGVTKVDPRNGTTLGRFQPPVDRSNSCELAVLDTRPSQVWFLQEDFLVAIDPATGEEFSSRMVYRFQPDPSATGPITVSYLAVVNDLALVAVGETLFVVDGPSGKVSQRRLTIQVDALEADGGRAYAVDVFDGRLVRLDPSSGEILDSTPTSAFDLRLRVGEGYVWILDRELGVVTRYAPGDLGPRAGVQVATSPSDMDVGLGAAWIGAADGLYRVDPVTAEVTRVFAGQPVGSVAVDDDAGLVWVHTLDRDDV
jgi:hypothetical protein